MINLSSIRLVYGDRVIFKKADFLVKPNDRIGLVGPNGAGKTSLFRLLTGAEHPDEGSVNIDPGVILGYFSQETAEMSGRSALQEVLASSGKIFEIGQALAQFEERMSNPALKPLSDAEMESYGELQNEFLARDGYDLENRAETVLTGLGIGPDRFHQAVENFSGGWKMRIALAGILVQNPDVLLLDEPTNHLDIESILWLENWLTEFQGQIVMTCHDREFMVRICKKTIEVSQGEITTYSGDYDFYLRERELRREQQIAAYRRQQAMLAKEEEFIARFGARASHAAQVQSRVKTIEKIERVELPKDEKAMSISYVKAGRSGDQVVVLKDLAKTWPKADGGVHPVFSGLTGVIERGNKIALTGINGAGKSTLLKVMIGETNASQGSCVLGGSVLTGYFSQYSSDLLEPKQTIYQAVEERLPQASTGVIKSILGAFQFSGDDTDKKISVLSGGEKSRVMLACVLAKPVNFLVLDEPTNHLDIQSREVLLESLKIFDGTLIVVSHDRYFLKHLVNRVFEIDHGNLKIFEGDYDYYSQTSKS